MTKERRNPNVDLLRAIAILMVLFYHIVQMWPHPLPWLRVVSPLGAYGVDLFFAISGWLIGSLFWRELAASGQLRISRFILRRVLRTVPCYLVALALAWAAVRINDPLRASWDWHYLFFAQNLWAQLPYFQVSWSLCVEEHFYLAAPLGLWALNRIRPEWVGFSGLICLVPLVCRLFVSESAIEVFAPTWTATWFRFEGLLGGFLVARVRYLNPGKWMRCVEVAHWVAWLALPIATIVYYVSKLWFYRVGLSLVAMGFVSLTVTLSERSPVFLARPALVYFIAVTSYSTYLVHALMIHVARMLLAHIGSDSNLTCLLIFAATIISGSLIFYVCVERLTLSFREMIQPG